MNEIITEKKRDNDEAKEELYYEKKTNYGIYGYSYVAAISGKC